MARWIASHLWQANLAKFLCSSVGPSCGQSLRLICGGGVLILRQRDVQFSSPQTGLGINLV